MAEKASNNTEDRAAGRATSVPAWLLSMLFHAALLISVVIGLRMTQRTGVSAERIVEIQTTYTPSQQQADGLFERADYAAAVVLYGKALGPESRRWPRRRIIERMVRCYRAMGQYVGGGEAFLLLTRDASTSVDLGCMPLAWTPQRPSADLQRAAQKWIARDDLPGAVLLGASHLLPVQRAEAIARLKQLAGRGRSLVGRRIGPLGSGDRTHARGATRRAVLRFGSWPSRWGSMGAGRWAW